MTPHIILYKIRYKMVKYSFISILFIVSTIFAVSFLSLIGGSPLYRLNNMINLSILVDKLSFSIWNDIIAGAYGYCPVFKWLKQAQFVNVQGIRWLSKNRTGRGELEIQRNFSQIKILRILLINIPSTQTRRKSYWLLPLKVSSILSPPANTLSSDVTMHAVHFWGQERSYLSGQSVLPVTEKERKGRGNIGISPWMKYGRARHNFPFPSPLF